MASLDMSQFHTLEELRGSLPTYAKGYNQAVHSSLKVKLNPALYKVIYSSLSTVTIIDFYRNLASALGAEPAAPPFNLPNNNKGSASVA